MNQDLQKLIDIAKDGDAITPKQREIILRKAQELGEDLDEVEMVLESLQSKQIAKEPAKKNEERRKCPNCGATISVSYLVCPECGYVLQQENKAQMEARNLIIKLEQELAEAAKPATSFEKMFPNDNAAAKRKAEIVNAFTMPTTKESLSMLLDFAFSNYVSLNQRNMDIASMMSEMNLAPLKDAWYAKATQAYNTLDRMGANNPEIKSMLEKYSSLFTKEKKKINVLTIFFIAMFIMFIITLAIVIPTAGMI